MIRLAVFWAVYVAYIVASPSQQRANCDINPNLPFCDKTADDETLVRNNDDSKDQRACRQLRSEYYMNCTGKTKKRDEFCAAYENICIRGGLDEFGLNDDTTSKKAKKVKKRKTKKTPKRSKTTQIEAPEEDSTKPPSSSGKVDQDSSATSKKASKSKPKSSQPVEEAAKDYTDFCAQYKRRFLYVCPDPFRFGERAAIFCPVYSERCHVPLPDKPVVPTDPPPPTSEDLVAQNPQNPFAQQICSQYRGFAANYCQNPAAMQMNVVRDGCDKYRRYCTDQRQPSNGAGFGANFGPWNQNRPVAQPQNFVAPWSSQFNQQRPFRR